MLLKKVPPLKETMAHAKAKRARDRYEADLLMDVVLAHMAWSSTKDELKRTIAREHFKKSVRKFHQFVIEEGKEVSGAAPT